jgi:hypothetical protein
MIDSTSLKAVCLNAFDDYIAKHSYISVLSHRKA